MSVYIGVYIYIYIYYASVDQLHHRELKLAQKYKRSHLERQTDRLFFLIDLAGPAVTKLLVSHLGSVGSEGLIDGVGRLWHERSRAVGVEG